MAFALICFILGLADTNRAGLRYALLMAAAAAIFPFYLNPADEAHSGEALAAFTLLFLTDAAILTACLILGWMIRAGAQKLKALHH